MKIEPRGKYAGVKVHLDGDEAAMFLEWVKNGSKAPIYIPAQSEPVITFASKLGGKIQKLISEVPNLLEDRTEEQIKASMEKDLAKIHAQQEAMAKGKDWKAVK